MLCRWLMVLVLAGILLVIEAIAVSQGTFIRDQRVLSGSLVQGSRNVSSGPAFETNVPRNVTTAVGQTAFLHCRVHQLGDKGVSHSRDREEDQEEGENELLPRDAIARLQRRRYQRSVTGIGYRLTELGRRWLTPGSRVRNILENYALANLVVGASGISEHHSAMFSGDWPDILGILFDRTPFALAYPP